jgi:hypothetical protein
MNGIQNKFCLKSLDEFANQSTINGEYIKQNKALYKTNWKFGIEFLLKGIYINDDNLFSYTN